MNTLKMIDENNQLAEVQKDLADYKEKLKIMTQKFAQVRKERD